MFQKNEYAFQFTPNIGILFSLWIIKAFLDVVCEFIILFDSWLTESQVFIGEVNSVVSFLGNLLNVVEVTQIDPSTT